LVLASGLVSAQVTALVLVQVSAPVLGPGSVPVSLPVLVPVLVPVLRQARYRLAAQSPPAQDWGLAPQRPATALSLGDPRLMPMVHCRCPLSRCLPHRTQRETER
jgi:hypothetical protein